MGQSKHILVVDDNGDVRDAIVASLQSHDYRVSSPPGGSVMRDFLETAKTVDCVILDALMPGEASASLALDLKERGISVVMISGNPDAMKYPWIMGSNSSENLFTYKSSIVPLRRRSPAVSSDSDYKAAVNARKHGRKQQCPVGTCLTGPAPARL
jgi:CheY-like chemotaxis protein